MASRQSRLPVSTARRDGPAKTAVKQPPTSVMKENVSHQDLDTTMLAPQNPLLPKPSGRAAGKPVAPVPCTEYKKAVTNKQETRSFRQIQKSEEELQHRVGTLQRQLTVATQQHDQLKETTARQICDLEARLSLAEERCAAAETLLKEKTAEMSQSHCEEIAALQQRLVQMEASLATVTSQRNALAQFAEDAGLDTVSLAKFAALSAAEKEAVDAYAEQTKVIESQLTSQLSTYASSVLRRLQKTQDIRRRLEAAVKAAKEVPGMQEACPELPANTDVPAASGRAEEDAVRATTASESDASPDLPSENEVSETPMHSTACEKDIAPFEVGGSSGQHPPVLGIPLDASSEAQSSESDCVTPPVSFLSCVDSEQGIGEHNVTSAAGVNNESAVGQVENVQATEANFDANSHHAPVDDDDFY